MIKIRVENFPTKYLFSVSVVVEGFKIGTQRENVAMLARFLTSPFHKFQNVNKVFSDVMIFFQKHHQTCVISGYFQLIENSVSFPPPVVFGLCEFGFSIMPIQIWIKCVITLFYQRSEIGKNRKRRVCSKYHFWVLTVLVWCLVDSRLDPRQGIRVDVFVLSTDKIFG